MKRHIFLLVMCLCVIMGNAQSVGGEIVRKNTNKKTNVKKRMVVNSKSQKKSVYKSVEEYYITDVDFKIEEIEVNNLKDDGIVFIGFPKGKHALGKEEMDVLDKIQTGSVVEVVGIASNDERNGKEMTLSQMRADVIASYLFKRGCKIRLSVGRGIQGQESSPLGIVYVKLLE